MTSLLVINYAAYLLTGAAVGAIYFFILYQNARLHLAGAPAGTLLALYAVRLAVALGVFWMIAHQGAAALLLALAGFIAGRLAIQQFVVARQ